MHISNLQTAASPASSASRRHICAWCRRDLPVPAQGGELHSYGICEDCIRQHFLSLYAIEEDLAEDVISPSLDDSQPEPIFRAVGEPMRETQKLAL